MSEKLGLSARLRGHLPLNVVQALCGFGALALFSHVLSPDDFGRYALLLSCMMLAHTIAFTWIEAAAFRFQPIARKADELADHFRTLLALGAAASLAAGLICALALATLVGDHDMLTASALAALVTLTRFINRVARETERADHRIGRYSIMEAISLIGGFGLGAAAIIWLDLGPIGPFLGLAVIGIVLAAIDMPRLIAQSRGGRCEHQRLWRYAGYGAPLALALIVDLAAQTAVRLVLEHNAGPAAVGAYAAAFGLSGRLLDLTFLWAGLAAAPLTMQAFENGGAAAAREQGARLIIVLTALAAPAAAGLALTAPELSAVMIGPGLREQAGHAAGWLALSGLLSGLTLYYFCEAFNLTKRTGIRAALMIAPALAFVAASAWLAPDHGARGAAWAAAGSSVFGLILIAAIGRRLLPLPLPWVAFGKVALAVGAMSCVVSVTPSLGDPLFTLVAKSFIGCGVYGSFILMLDLGGARSAASAVWQRLRAKVHPGAVEAQT
jgi:O-antigen/teichoic acid export membrane protein